MDTSFHEQVFNLLPVPTCVLDIHGRFKAISDSLRTLFGNRSLDELYLQDFIVEDLGEILRPCYAARSVETQVFVRQAGARPIPATLSVRPTPLPPNSQSHLICSLFPKDPYETEMTLLRERLIDGFRTGVHAMNIAQTCSIFNQHSQTIMQPSEAHFTPSKERPNFSLRQWRLFDTDFQNELDLENFPIREAMRGHQFSALYGCIMPDGSRRILDIKALPLYFEKHRHSRDFKRAGIFGGATYIDDVTETYRSKINVQKEKDELKQQRRVAEEANRLKTQFLSNVSHEIRTPVAAIKGLVGFLSDAANKVKDAQNPPCIGSKEMGEGPLAIFLAEQGDLVSQIKEQLAILLQLINDVLDLNKVESGRFQLAVEPFRLTDLLGELVRATSFSAQAASTHFVHHINISADSDLVSGDPGRIRQIAQNLLSNAVKFSDQGAVTLEAQARRQFAGAVSLDIKVTDNGIGLTKEQLNRLWQPFSQADASVSRLFGGTGLGLSISRALCHEMRGTIRLSSNGPGKGSVSQVHLVLPSAPSDAFTNDTLFRTRSRSRSHTSPTASPERFIERETRQDRRVLVAEDNNIIRKISVSQLQKLGFVHIDTVADGRQAIRAVEAKAEAKAPYDMVFMDLQMPVTDGLTACRHLRQRFPATDLPIIALTASAIRGDEEQSYDAGMQGHLAKPISLDKLEAVVTQFLVT